METMTKCPLCGKSLEPGTRECPNCGEKIHHHRKGQRNDLILDFVEAPLSPWVLHVALLLALVGQGLLLAFNPHFYQFLRPQPEVSLFWGHLLKTMGETTLLFALMKGLSNERHNLRSFFLAAIVSLLAYHLLVALFLQVSLNVYTYYTGVGLLVVSTVAYLVLGFMMEERFYGGLFYLACLLILYVSVFFVFNFILKWSGKELFADVIITVLAMAYLIFLRTRLLDHKGFKRYKYKRGTNR